MSEWVSESEDGGFALSFSWLRGYLGTYVPCLAQR